jgi:hypothetical protein
METNNGFASVFMLALALLAGAQTASASDSRSAYFGVLVGHATKGGGSHGLGLGLEAGAQLPEFDGFTVGLSTLTFTSDSSTRTRDFQTLVMVDGRFHVESFDRGLWVGLKLGAGQYSSTLRDSADTGSARDVDFFGAAVGAEAGYTLTLADRMRLGASISRVQFPFLDSRAADVDRGVTAFTAHLGFAL